MEYSPLPPMIPISACSKVLSGVQWWRDRRVIIQKGVILTESRFRIMPNDLGKSTKGSTQNVLYCFHCMYTLCISDEKQGLGNYEKRQEEFPLSGMKDALALQQRTSGLKRDAV